MPRPPQPIAVFGRPATLALPPICPSCGAPADVPLPVAQAFARRRQRTGVTGATVRGVTTYHIAAVDVPFCARCAAGHRTELAARQPRGSVATAVATSYGLPAAGALVCALIFAGFVANQLEQGWSPTVVFAGSIVVGFLILGAWFGWQGLAAARALALPAPSGVTAAFTLGDDESQPFEPTWRHYTFRRDDYARAFAAANAGRLWSPEGPAARRAAALRRGIRVAGLLAFAALLLFVAFRSRL